MLGNPKKKNVLVRLKDLEDAARAARIIPGEGIGVTFSANGVIISAEARDDDSVLGAFDIRPGHLVKDRENKLYIPGDTDDNARFRVVNSDEEQYGFEAMPESCGIMTVNNQPFEVPYFEGEATRKNKWQYVYAVFTPPSYAEAPDAFSDPPQEKAATARIELKDALEQSTPGALHYLLGRVRMRVEKVADGENAKKTRELKSVEISLEHQPGELRCIWWGPCLGLLQEQPFYYDASTDENHQGG